MKKARRLLLLLLTLVLAVVGAGSLWVGRAKQQNTRNRQFIDALVRHDNKAALVLVQQGADPNTRQEAVSSPSLLQLLHQLLHRSPPDANDSPTALQLACGGVQCQELIQHLTTSLSPDDVPLVQAMLAQGADIEATNEDKYTALFYAILSKHPHTAQFLLDHGAKINVPHKYSRTPLMLAVGFQDMEIVRFLLEHGASVTPTDREGSTALHYAVRNGSDRSIVRLLLAHGAAPYARNQYDRTPLILAQRYHRSDLEALLRGKR